MYAIMCGGCQQCIDWRNQAPTQPPTEPPTMPPTAGKCESTRDAYIRAGTESADCPMYAIMCGGCQQCIDWRNQASTEAPTQPPTEPPTMPPTAGKCESTCDAYIRAGT